MCQVSPRFPMGTFPHRTPARGGRLGFRPFRLSVALSLPSARTGPTRSAPRLPLFIHYPSAPQASPLYHSLVFVPLEFLPQSRRLRTQTVQRFNKQVSTGFSLWRCSPSTLSNVPTACLRARTRSRSFGSACLSVGTKA